MSTVSLDRSHQHCHEVTRQRARNFYYGLKLTPEPKRSALYAVYAWMRLADDLADEPGDDVAKADRLRRFGEQTLAVLDGRIALPEPVWPAMCEAVARFDVPREYLTGMIDGQLQDMTTHRYAAFDDLYTYCYRVASTVGLTCLQIWGYDGGEATRQLAEWRGIAFQLTNILRDVREDADRDRVYLPAEDFEVHQLNPAMFQFSPQPEALAGIKRTVARAGDYYRRSSTLIDHVHPDGRASLWAMTSIYHGIFRKIQRRPGVVLESKRVRLASAHKAMIALRAWWRRGVRGQADATGGEAGAKPTAPRDAGARA